MDRADYINHVTPARAGWNKSLQNPVLGGQSGTCFDLTMLEQSGLYRMWFSWRPKKSIAYTDSTDGIHWSPPIIVLRPRATREGWEDDLNRPSVVWLGGLYHMWYTGQYPGKLPRAADGRSWIFYATSRDGLIWTRVSSQPVISAEQPWEDMAVMCPSVLWDDGEQQYKMWYSGGEQYEPNAIGYATSPDGSHWEKNNANPIFFANPEAPWEKHKVTACQVVRKDGWHWMFYVGFWDEDTAQIGIARSRDGITGWERHPENPIIGPSKNEWDGDACYKPFAIFDGSNWRLWYNGRKEALEQIGTAAHPGEDLGFPSRQSSNCA